MTKFCSVALIIALVAIVTAPATFLVDGAKAKNAAGINKADTAACISQGNDACGEGRCCMFYWGYGCEQTSDGITTDRYPWMKCLDPANTGNETAVPMDAEPLALTDEQIDMANAVLNACPEDAAAIEDCEAALDDMMANMPGDTTSSASALNVAAAATVAAAASLVGATMAAMN